MDLGRTIRRVMGFNTGVAPAEALYGQVVNAARQPMLYNAYGVPDTVDGRFDMIVLHLFLLIDRFSGEGRQHPVLQAVLEELFVDMDRSLRELGAGDTGVKKRIHVMIDSLYGRLEAYNQALKGGEAEMAAALARNVYRAPDAAPAGVESLTGYVYRARETLAGQTEDAILAGAVQFPMGEAGEPQWAGRL
ncbi:MAG: ubiquinol-cytochrome C chaperone family protein [Alphaproteobacteria bacterium]|nr:ubiquinol-cytochrome C chaperone family protein [Alphaproteobacteria bacterium]